jgi:hypothetical protein
MIAVSRANVGVCVLLLCIAVGVAASPASTFAALPANDDFASATDLGNGASASASDSNLWATAEPREPGHMAGRALATVWYRWTASQSGVVSVRTCGSTFDTTLAVFRGPAFGALGAVAANDDRCGDQSALRFFAIASTTYQISIGGYRGAQGSIQLRLRYLVPPSNDDFADALDLGNDLTASASGTNGDATIEPKEPNHAGERTMASVWYRWTAPDSRKVRLESCGSDFDTMIAVYVGEGVHALRSVASNDDRCRTRSVVRFNSAAGTTYRIAVAGYQSAQGAIKLKLVTLKRSARRTHYGT